MQSTFKLSLSSFSISLSLVGNTTPTLPRFSYTIELPDDGRKHGFLLPPARVPEVVEDMWVALK